MPSRFDNQMGVSRPGRPMNATHRFCAAFRRATLPTFPTSPRRPMSSDSRTDKFLQVRRVALLSRLESTKRNTRYQQIKFDG